MQNLVIPRCCFVKNGKEMNKELTHAYTVIVPFALDVFF